MNNQPPKRPGKVSHSPNARLKHTAVRDQDIDRQINKEWSSAEAAGPRKSEKHPRILVTLPTRVLKDVDWLAPLEDMTRDQLILEAVKRFLKPHLEIRKQLLKPNKGQTYGPFETAEEMIAFLKAELRKDRKTTKAISESTDRFKTGRYEGPVD